MSISSLSLQQMCVSFKNFVDARGSFFMGKLASGVKAGVTGAKTMLSKVDMGEVLRTAKGVGKDAAQLMKRKVTVKGLVAAGAIVMTLLAAIHVFVLASKTIATLAVLILVGLCVYGLGTYFDAAS